MGHIAKTPAPPYYAVTFTSTRTADASAYAETAAQMEHLAAQQPGFLGIESVPGITICYWRDLESIQRWKGNVEHQARVRGLVCRLLRTHRQGCARL